MELGLSVMMTQEESFPPSNSSPSGFFYLRNGGTFFFLRPDGTSKYGRP